MKTFSLIIIATLFSVMIKTASDFDYDAAWKEAETLESNGFTRDLEKKLDEILLQAKKDKLAGQAIAAFSRKMNAAVVNQDSVWLKINEELSTSFSPAYAALLKTEKASILSSVIRGRNTNINDQDSGTLPSELSPESRRNLAYDLYIEAVQESSLSQIDFDEIKHAIRDLGQDTLFYQTLTAKDLVVKSFLDFLNRDEGLENTSDVAFTAAQLMSAKDQYLKLNFSVDKDSRINTIAYLFKNLMAEDRKSPIYEFWIDKSRMDYFRSIYVDEQSQKYYNDFLAKAGASKDLDVSLLAQLTLINQSLEKDSLHPELMQQIEKLEKSHQASKFYDQLLQLKKEIAAAKLSYNSQQVFYKGQLVKIDLKLRNTEKLSYKLYKISATQLKEFASVAENWEDRKESLKMGAKKVNETSIGINLPAYKNNDYQLNIGKPAAGAYLIEITAMGKADDVLTEYLIFQITNISASLLNDSEENHIYVNDRKSGKPVKNAVVSYFKRTYRYGGDQGNLPPSNKTDASGKIIANGRGTFGVMVSEGRDTFVSINDMVNIYQGGRGEGGVQKEAIIYTDRAIYRPGQTVFYKIIVSEYKYNGYGEALSRKVLSGVPVSVQIRDANYEELEKSNLGNTNGYGSVSGQFTIPKGRLNGYYQIETPFGSRGVQVEEYKRPSFEITEVSKKKGVKRSDVSTIEIMAAGLAGNKINNANVTYSITRQVVTPRCYWFLPQDNVSTVIEQGNGKTDKDGKFVVSFSDDTDLIPKPVNKSLVYSIQINVTDQAGETQSYQTSITFNDQAVFLSIIANDQIDKNLDPQISVQAFDNNMDSLNTDVVVTIYQRKKPKSWRDPVKEQNYYEAQTPVDLSELKEVRKTMVKSWSKLTIEEDPGEYYILASTPDKSTSFGKWIQVTDFKRASFPTAALLYCRTNKTSLIPGESLEVKIGSEEKLYVRLILKRGNNTLKNEVIRVNGTENFVYKITESDRGGLTVFLQTLKENHFETRQLNVDIPWDNKVLDVKIESFRDKILPGANEEIKLLIAHKGKPAAAEIMASLYDASLDMLQRHEWQYNFYYSNYGYVNWRDLGAGTLQGGAFYVNGIGFPHPEIPALFQQMYYPQVMYKRSMNAPVEMQESMADASLEAEASGVPPSPPPPPGAVQEPISVRENLNELVFFFPRLEPDKDGKYTISYKMNDALTRWHLMVLAHDKEMRFGFGEAFITTQKPLMIRPNKPRLLRKGDKIEITANVSNLSEKDFAAVNYQLILKNAVTGEAIDWAKDKSGNIALQKGETKAVSWEIAVPDMTNIDLLEYTMAVSSDGNSDAEKDIIPIVANKILVTESYPFGLRSGKDKSFKIELPGQVENVVFEYTSDPAWTAFAALPSLTEDIYQGAGNIMERIYGHEMGLKIVQSSPDYANALKMFLASSNAYTSKLEENQELKQLLLQATPFVSAAKNEVKNYQGLAKYLNVNNVRSLINSDLIELKKYQNNDGGFAWAENKTSDVYTTSRVLSYLVTLQNAGIDVSSYGLSMEKMGGFILNHLEKRYQYLKDKKQLDGYAAGNEVMDMWLIHQSMKKAGFSNAEAYKFFLERNMKNWNKASLYLKPILGRLAIAENKMDVAKNVLKYFDQNKTSSEEMGTHWETRTMDAFYSTAIDQHAAIMEFYKAMGATDEALDEMKIWLIKNKQVNGWQGNSRTTEAVHSLLLTGKGKESQMSHVLPGLSVDGKAIDLQFQAGKGQSYIKMQLPLSDLPKGVHEFSIKNNADHINYGGLYIQFWRDADKVKKFDGNPLSLRKELYLETTNAKGKALQLLKDGDKVQPGDVIVSRLIIESDRDMDYVALTDTRPSGFEPVKDKESFGFWFYPDYRVDITDYQANYFFYSLPKGKKIIENRMIAVHRGDFSGGLASLQSQYAPEFSSHSDGTRVKVSR